jgi:hypothetical protein
MNPIRTLREHRHNRHVLQLSPLECHTTDGRQLLLGPTRHKGSSIRQVRPIATEIRFEYPEGLLRTFFSQSSRSFALSATINEAIGLEGLGGAGARPLNIDFEVRIRRGSKLALKLSKETGFCCWRRKS